MFKNSVQTFRMNGSAPTRGRHDHVANTTYEACWFVFTFLFIYPHFYLNPTFHTTHLKTRRLFRSKESLFFSEWVRASTKCFSPLDFEMWRWQNESILKAKPGKTQQKQIKNKVQNNGKVWENNSNSNFGQKFKLKRGDEFWVFICGKARFDEVVSGI